MKAQPEIPDFPDVGLEMVRVSLKEIPQHDLPKDYHFRAYRHGDEEVWVHLQRAAERIIPLEDLTLDLFENQFGKHREALCDRMFFVETGDGINAASITAWWRTGRQIENDDDTGLIHWVVVHPDHQGRGLSKAMMTRALKRLSKSHGSASLYTSSHRLRAVKVYLDFGFEPERTSLIEEKILTAWRNVQSALEHSVLDALLTPDVD